MTRPRRRMPQAGSEAGLHGSVDLEAATRSWASGWAMAARGQVLADRADRAAGPGGSELPFCCSDGLKGLPESIKITCPRASIQTCAVHQIRASLRYSALSP